jgi:hypothetical protein
VTCRAASRVGITVCRLRWHPTYAGEQPVYMKEAAPRAAWSGRRDEFTGR